MKDRGRDRRTAHAVAPQRPRVSVYTLAQLAQLAGSWSPGRWWGRKPKPEPCYFVVQHFASQRAAADAAFRLRLRAPILDVKVMESGQSLPRAADCEEKWYGVS